MHDTLEALNRFFAALPAWLLGRRIAVWCFAIALTVVSGVGLGRLEVDMTMESFFFENDPVRLLHERFKDTFGSDEGVYIVYEARDGDVLSSASLEAARGVERALLDASGDKDGDDGSSDTAPLQHIVDVTTIANASYLEVKGDILVSRDFVEVIPTSEEEREALRRRALAHKDYPRFYISTDSRFGGIWIRTDLGALPPESTSDDAIDEMFDSGLADESELATPHSKPATMVEYAAFARAITAVTGRAEFSRALEFHAVGNPMIMGFFNDVLVDELDALFSSALLIMMVVLGVLFRSMSGVIWPVAIVGFAAVLTLGLLGWLGLKLSLMISVLVILILVVGIADSVHIMSGYLHDRGKGAEHRQALERVFRKSGLACLLTSVTTALGMLSLVFVPLPPLRNFGLASALGVTAAFGFTMVLLPLMLDLWPPARSKEATAQPAKSPWVQRVLGSLEPIASRWPVRVVAVFAIVGVVGAYGVSQVQVDSNLVEIIRPGLPIRAAHDLVDHVMGGTQGMEIYLDFGETDALKDPRVLNAMEGIQELLEVEHPEFVVRTDSLADMVKNTFQALNEDREQMYRIPQERAALAQTLLLFDLANPEDREQLVPDDYSEARINVRMFNYGSAEYVEFFNTVNEHTRAAFGSLANDYSELEVGITGSLPLVMRMADYIGRAQIQSFVLVLIVVTVLLLIAFGSPRAGLVAMVPNVYPVLITFGVMGLWKIPLDVDTLIIAPLIIGIAVDDTIHFITHYRAFALETGDVRRAIAATISEVGQAITFTSVILVLGFMVLVTSNHQGIAHFGILIGISLATALLADLLLLPALLQLCRVRFESSE
ncbi:MAG: MMPL family transporter [bacterium]|nr:MMPL family transporter [bacterium]